MKLTFVALLLIGIKFTLFGQEARTAGDYKKLEWLVGTWNRTNITRAGRSSNERWEKTADGQLKGIGVTLQSLDTIFIEKISLQLKEGAIYYVADVPENKEPVFFKLTEITNTGFVCENPGHDFPKKISYQVEGHKLKAQISGDGKSVDYIFERAK
jgi:hypothetical protein